MASMAVPWRNCKLSRRLSDIMGQLRKGRTHGRNPRELTLDDIEALRAQADDIRAHLQQLRGQSGRPVDRYICAGKHLYVMQRSDAPDLLMIGRSNDPVRRASTLQCGHCFSMRVLFIIPNTGSKEHSVHDILQEHRVSGGPSTEWFRISLAQAMSAIHSVLDS